MGWQKQSGLQQQGYGTKQRGASARQEAKGL
jgi:hypothetical protein